MRNTVLHIQAKVHPATAPISVKFRRMKEDKMSRNAERVIFVSLTVLEIFALIVDLSFININN